MEKTNLKSVRVLLGLIAIAGLAFFAVTAFYSENEAITPVKKELLAQDTLLTYKFKSVRAYDKPEIEGDSLVDKGCKPIDLDVIVIGGEDGYGTEVHFVFNMIDISTTDVFNIVATNPENGNQILVVDAYGRRSIFTMVCNPSGDETAGQEHSAHKHWLATEGLTEFAVYSTQEGECEFLRGGN